MMNYNMSMNKQNIIDRLMCASACIIQALAFYISLNHEAFKSTIIPFPNIVIPTLNITTSVLCLFLTFFPKFSYLKISILFVQSVATTLNELEILGTFLYAAAIILLFCDRFFKIKVKRKIIILSVIWFLVSLGTIPFGLHRFLRVVALSLFFITFYLSIYFRLEEYLTPLLPVKALTKSNITLPEKAGSKINLKDYNLTDRQISLIKSYLRTNASYSELAKEHNISISLVKHEMRLIFSIFEVPNLRELHVLLYQYVII